MTASVKSVVYTREWKVKSTSPVMQQYVAQERSELIKSFLAFSSNDSLVRQIVIILPFIAHITSFK
jgi:hypothetical protein